VSADGFLKGVSSPGLWVVVIAINGWNFMESKHVMRTALSALSSCLWQVARTDKGEAPCSSSLHTDSFKSLPEVVVAFGF